MRDARLAEQVHSGADAHAGEVVDVAVVGGGPVGLALACLLAQRRVDVAVFERRSVRATRPKAIGVHPPGWDVLEASGVAGALEPVTVSIEGGQVGFAGRVLGRMRFTGRTPVRSVPQHLVEAALERRLGQLAPGALRRGAEVVGVAACDASGPDRGAGRARGARHGRAGHSMRGFAPGRGHGTSGVVVELADGGRVAARYAVLADGVRSRLRAELGVAWRLRRGSARYAMADLEGTGPARVGDAIARLYFEAGGVVESLPMPAGRRWVVHLGDRDPTAELDATAFAAIVADRTGIALDAVPEPSRFVARQHVARRFAVGRIALAGDAAHEVSPIGGQGMTLGLRDASLLAGVLAGALAAADGTRDAETPFAGYERARRRAARRACRRAAFNMAMGAPARGIRLMLRNAAVRALALPPTRALLARVFTMRGL